MSFTSSGSCAAGAAGKEWGQSGSGSGNVSRSASLASRLSSLGASASASAGGEREARESKMEVLLRRMEACHASLKSNVAAVEGLKYEGQLEL